MDRKVEQYILKHNVTPSDAPIFRDWKEFLHILYQNGGRVNMIVWYEYCKINQQQLGMGGYIDTENQGFMWAETQLFQTDLQEKPLTEVLAYIRQMQQEYWNYDLYPQFYLG